MTREEIEILKDFKKYTASFTNSRVLEKAIKALEQEPCEDCISRADMKKAIIDHQYSSEFCAEHHIDHSINTNMILIALSDLSSVRPKAEQEPRPKTGHWIEIAKYSDGQHKIGCSECGGYIFDRGHANSFNVREKYKYCPNCGAKMSEILTGSESSEKINCKAAKCENCINHNYCDYEPRKSEG